MSENKPKIGMMAIARWAAPFALRRWKGLLLVLAVMLLRVGFDVLRPWPMKVIVDYVLGDKVMSGFLARGFAVFSAVPSPQLIVLLCIAATVVFYLAGWGMGLVTTMANISFGQRMVYDLAAKLFAHIQRLSLRFHTTSTVGDLIRRVTSDCGCVSVIIKDGVLTIITSVVTLLTMFVVMWKISPMLTLLSLGVLPLIVLALKVCMKPMQERSYVQQEQEAKIYEVIEQTLSSVSVVQAFGAEAREEARFRAATAGTLAAAVSLTNVQLLFKILLGFATATGTAAILWVGTRQALAGAVTVGDLLVFLAYLASLYGPIEAMMYSPATIQGASGSARRVLEVLQRDQDVNDAPNAKPMGRAKGHVTMEAVRFGYLKDRIVLDDVSLEARPGETIAIVGPTGAGKSTLAGLLLRFFDPWSGKVTLDGEDLRNLKVEDLRKQVAMVLQEPFLFPRTIAENIAYSRPGATVAEVESAARAANAHEFIVKLPKGYDTQIGERGATLSGGQRQRLAIARALLKDAPVLILDEPTSALDAATETLLLEALARLMTGRTTFIIAHRLSTIRNATGIVVLENGKVVETGSHEKLLEKGGLYAKLYRLSVGSSETAPTGEAKA
jgi:ATP-binding cassette, subfamily B, bacterial